MPIDTSYRPLSEEEQSLTGSQILPSGEANFAAYSQQVTELEENVDNPNAGVGIIDSAFAPIFGASNFSSASVARKNVSNLAIFRPYIHYYPVTRVENLSLYAETITTNYFTIDYSFVFEASNYYNWYKNYGQYEFGEDFTDPSLIPPRDFY